MKWLAMSIVALAGLGGIAFAFAATTGAGGARAFALVDPNNGAPRLVEAHTSGFVSVSVGPAGPGDYCLAPSPGVDVVNTAAVADVEAFYSNAVGFPAVRYPTAGSMCPAGQLEVKTFTDNPVGLSDQIAFTLYVP